MKPNYNWTELIKDAAQLEREREAALQGERKAEGLVRLHRQNRKALAEELAELARHSIPAAIRLQTYLQARTEYARDLVVRYKPNEAAADYDT